MGKKVNLPLFEDPAERSEESSPQVSSRKPPSVDAARSRLGGRIPTPSENETDRPPAWLTPGALVELGQADARRVGVVIFASSTEVHVLLDSVRLRRGRVDEVRPLAAAAATAAAVVTEEADVALELARIAADAGLFGRLTEGEAVRYADDSGNLVDGRVVEKCRWGALVLREDGAVIAIGFRKLWPSTSHGVA